jgi:hypothetical protein
MDEFTTLVKPDIRKINLPAVVQKSALMKPLRSRAVEQCTFSSPLRMAERWALPMADPGTG